MSKEVSKAARKADGNSRRGAQCAYHPCSVAMFRICGDSFVEGFNKGVKWNKRQNKGN